MDTSSIAPGVVIKCLRYGFAATIQPFNHSTIQPFNHSTIQPFNHSTI
ncbi:MAG: hypothetical protein IPO83_01975 [Chitinophagaceae bacterium]|nr:hypothetical protein [Chitinophagaceae bacterium]